MAWVGFALVNVPLTAPSLETGQAVASIRAWHIHAGSTMLTRRAYKRRKKNVVKKMARTSASFNRPGIRLLAGQRKDIVYHIY